MTQPQRGSLAHLLPDGMAPPADIPAEVFEAAVTIFLTAQRLDMQALAAQLGMSRSTLYRKVRDRDQLLSAVIWYLSRRALHPLLIEADALSGVDRILFVIERFMSFAHAQPSLHRFLDAEPEAALRILTSKHGCIQRSLVDLTERALEQEEAAGTIVVTIDRRTLAFLITRLNETFLYSDVIADNELDIALAVDIIGKLLRVVAVPPG